MPIATGGIELDVDTWGGENECDGPVVVALVVGGAVVTLTPAKALRVARALRKAATRAKGERAG